MAKLTQESKSLIDDMMDHLKFWLKDYPLKEIRYRDNRFPDNTESFCITVVHDDGRVQCLHRPVNPSGLNAKWNADYFKENFKL